MTDVVFWWVGYLVVMTGGLILTGAIVWWGMAAAVTYWGKLVIPIEAWRDILCAQRQRNTERQNKRKHWLCSLNRHKWGATLAHGELEWECRRCGAFKPMRMEASDDEH